MGAVAVLLAAIALPAAAQDTPEMLAAMRGHLPPVPEQVPVLDALPAALREQIPPFRLEVHRWHDDPALRFAVIHGRRIAEGDVIDRDLWLRQVRPDGIVVQFRSMYFLLLR